MTITRRTLVGAALALPAVASAQAPWPARPVAFVTGVPPGSTIDLVARTVAQALTARLGQSVVVDSRPGGSNNISVQHVLRQPADGLTLGFAPITMGTNPALMNIGYDPIADVIPVAQMSAVPVAIMVGAHVPYKTLPEMVAYAKANPERVTLGHGGTGTSGFLASQLLARDAGFSFLPVPFSGSAPVFQAMLAGQVDGTFTPVDGTLPGLVQSGRMRALAVMQPTRIALLPEAPTTREAGFGPAVDFRSWHGTFLKAGTPQPIVDRWFEAITTTIRDPEVSARLAAAGVEPAASTSRTEFDAFYRSEITRWADLIKALGIQPA